MLYYTHNYSLLSEYRRPRFVSGTDSPCRTNRERAAAFFLAIVLLFAQSVRADFRADFEREIDAYENAAAPDKVDQLNALLDATLDNHPEEVLGYFSDVSEDVAASSPEIRLLVHDARCWAHFNVRDPQSTTSVCTALAEEAINQANGDIEGSAYNTLGAVAVEQGKDIEGLRLYDKALEVAASPRVRAGTQINAGLLFMYSGVYELALERFTFALEETQDPSVSPERACYFAATAYSQIGHINQMLGDFPAATRYFQLALDCAKLSGTFWDHLLALSAITDMQLELDEIERADKASQEAEEIVAGMDSDEASGFVASSRAEVLLAQGRYDDALAAAQTARALASSDPAPVPGLYAMMLEARALSGKAQHAEAAERLQVVETGVRQMSDNDLLERFLEDKQEILLASGDYANAYAAAKEYIELSEASLREETLRKTSFLQALHEADREIAAATEEQMLLSAAEARAEKASLVRNLSIGGGMVILIVGYLLISRMYQARQAAETQRVKIELEKELTARTAALEDEAETRVLLETELLQAQKLDAVGQLTGGVAHDFNNLMTVVMGATELATNSNRSTLDESDKALLRSAYNAASLGAEITGQMLAFARKQPLQPKPTELASLIDGTQGMFGRVLGDRVELNIEVRDRPLWCEVDRAQLSTALLNLALNARDAMGRGGEIRISCRRVNVSKAHGELASGEHCCIEVVDSGRGMSAEDLDHAVEPFYTTKQQGSGNGLGLSMVYGFAKQSRGNFVLQSQLGEGTTASIWLPLCAAPQTADAGEAIAKEAVSESKALSVLVVEDQADVRRLAVRALTRRGYTVDVANDGDEARQMLLDGYRPSAVFSDISMPGEWNGIQFAHWLRDYAPDIPILLTSGYPQEDVLGEHIEFLAKPYQPDELIAAVARISAVRTGSPAVHA